MQKSVRISSISADILNLFSILTHSHTPSVVGRDNTKKGREKTLDRKETGCFWTFRRDGLIHFLFSWDVGFLFLDNSLWLRSSFLKRKSKTEIFIPVVFDRWDWWHQRLASWLPCSIFWGNCKKGFPLPATNWRMTEYKICQATISLYYQESWSF